MGAKVVPNAPIAFFTYNRPEHTKQSLASLSRCEGAAESELFIYSDGPKQAKDVNAVQEVRTLIKSRKWCGTVHIIERNENWGLARSIIHGVTEIVTQYGRVIVLEDDLVPSPQFLNYMNDALERYKDIPKVMHISGFMFKLDMNKDVTDTFFLRFPNSWGWATWERAWRYFCDDTQLLLDKVAAKGIDRFTVNGELTSYGLLEKQKKGSVDSWAVRWYATIFLKDGLVLYPGKSLVNNIGLDGSGVHCGKGYVHTDLAKGKIKIREMPISEDAAILKVVLKAKKTPIIFRMKSKIKRGLLDLLKEI